MLRATSTAGSVESPGDSEEDVPCPQCSTCCRELEGSLFSSQLSTADLRSPVCVGEQEAETTWTPTTVAVQAAPQGHGDVASALEDLDLSRA